MFWFWAIVSMLGFAVQNVLFAKYVRNIEVLSATFYRNVSLSICFLPVLYFVPLEKWLLVPEILGWMILAAFLATASLWTRYQALRHFPIGVSGSSISGLNVIFAWLFGWLYFGEVMDSLTLLALIIILSGTVTLAFSRQALSHLKSVSLLWGSFLIFNTSLLLSISFVILAKVARELDPILAAFLLEALIAPFALIFIWIKQLFGSNGLERITGSTFNKIFWCVTPTVLGTTGFTLAMKLGPLAIVSAISATGVIIVTLMSLWLYQEKLKTIQYAAIFVTVSGVIALKLFTS